MRFRRLELVRYGGFADRLLDFGDGEIDLHLVIGPNEAGKSTMLAAIGDLLFGIPQQSPQNWRYDYGDLRIRATVTGPAGALDVTRRKGNRNTLLGPDGIALPDDSLAPLLNGMDRRSFERMFGLDHAKLREGGQAILEGKDDAARIVLESGTGFGGIGHELAKLDALAGGLFKPSAQNPAVNRLMRDRTEALAVVRSQTLGDADWAAIKARRAAADAGRTALVEEGRTLAQRAHAIERINRIRPLLVRRASEQDALARLGVVPPMPADAGDQLATALAERRTARELYDLETAKRDRARKDASAIAIPEVLIAAKVEIETLMGRLPVVEKAQRDLVQRKAERATMLERASRIRQDAGLAADHPIAAAGPRKRLREMLEAGRRLEQDHAGYRHNRQAIEEELAGLPPLADGALVDGWLGALRSAVDAIASDASARMVTLAAARDRVGARLDNALAGLAPWSGSLETLRAAVAPGVSEALAAANALEAAQTTLRTAEADIVDQDKAQCALRSELASLIAAGALPTPEIVAAARGARDALVDEVRMRLASGRKDDDAEIGRALQEATGHADRLADGRDADAQRIAQHSVLTRRLAELDARIEAGRRIVSVETARRDAILAAWDAPLIQLGFARALPPGDIGRWRSERDRVLELADQRAEALRAFADFTAELDAQRTALEAALEAADIEAAPDAPLDGRMATARRAIARLEGQARSRDLAAAQRVRIDEAQARLTLAEQELEARRAAFEADRDRVLRESDLSHLWSADAVGDALDAFEDLAVDAVALAALDRQIAFDEDQVADFSAACGAVLASLDEPASSRLFEQLRVVNDAMLAAVRARETLRRLEGAERESGDILRMTRHRLESAEMIIQNLMAAADTASEERLAAAIAATRQAAAHKSELRRLAGELENQCEGLDLATVAQAAAALSPDDAAAELEAIRIRRQDIEEAREAVGRDLAAAEADMAGVASATAAADAQQDATAIGAAMADAAERHVEAAAAAALLRWVIDRHRATAQAPLIARAGAMFAQVTAGAFTGLVLDYGEGDKPQIRGLRADASRVGVEGMSEGTRDQLYLALRLAAVAGRAGSQALPVVCDDLLITADDGRAREMLRVLAAASTSNQIILFSHHDHIVDVAEAAVGKAGFRLHRIERSAPAPALA